MSLDTKEIIKSQKPIKNSFQDFAMTKETRKKINDMEYLVDGFLVKGYHTYLFGQAGSGKSTISFFLAKEILLKIKDINVVYFYIDGSLGMAANAFDMFEALNLNHRITITDSGTTDEYMSEMQKHINNKDDLSNIVFIFDTFKYMTNDINNKNANKKAMAFIKELCHITGCSFLSLGHTNKDGKNQSGTAEIEQDSDAIFRIDTVDNQDKSISTITPAGRVRLNPKDQSFEFIKGNISSVERLQDIKDIESISTEIEMENNDKDFIEKVKEFLQNNQEKTQSELVESLKNLELGNQKIVKKLKEYSDKYWKIKKGKNNTSIYYLIENTP